MNKILIGTIFAAIAGAGALVATQVDRSNTTGDRTRESSTTVTAPINSTQPVTTPEYDDMRGDPNTIGGHQLDDMVATPPANSTQPVISPDYIGNHTPRENTQVYTDQYDSANRDAARTSVPTNDPIRQPGRKPGHTTPVEGPVTDEPPTNPYPGGGMMDPGEYPPAPQLPPQDGNDPRDPGHTTPVEGPVTEGGFQSASIIDPDRVIQGQEDR